MFRSAVLVITLLLSLAISHTSIATEDIKGSSDHPLISRYKNSHIIQYSETDYDEYILGVGPVHADTEELQTLTLEGKITTLIYKTDSDKQSALKVYRNFQQAIKKGQFEVIFECQNDSCGYQYISKLIGDSARSSQYLQIDPWNIGGRNSDFRFLTAVYKQGDNTVYISLLVNKDSYTDSHVKIALDVIEVEAMETGLVAIDLNGLTNSIVNTGKAVLDGVYFDHGESVIKPQSQQALTVISDYLKSKPSAKVFIVGHTDNTGAYQQNISLSKARAQAVVDVLSNDFQIAKHRMLSVGIGEVSPVTSNANETGRAKNRRVEMVLMEN